MGKQSEIHDGREVSYAYVTLVRILSPESVEVETDASEMPPSVRVDGGHAVVSGGEWLSSGIDQLGLRAGDSTVFVIDDETGEVLEVASEGGDFYETFLTKDGGIAFWDFDGDGNRF